MINTSTIWNNTGKAISQLQINFDNGEGFKTITIGTPVTINYSDTGHVRWTVKATLSDATVLQCYNDYYVSEASVGSRYAAGGAIVPAWGIVDPVFGVHGGARVTVCYSNLSPTNTLRKPLIVVEGYDVSRILPGLQPNYDIADFIDALDDAEVFGWNFNEQLDEIAGYDLVFIDFNNGTDDILRNAAVVQEVINRVNTNKVNDTRFGGTVRQQNVVMGLSMGGLCARYALANMTKNFSGTPTETRLLITHDSPHRGANVPLGMQYLIRMAGEVELFDTDVRDIFPQYDQALGLLAEPATEQMLLYRSLTTTTMASNTFLNTTYRDMITFSPSDPVPTYRFIATSNGSECANPLFAPGTSMLNVNMDGFLFFFPLISYRLQTIAKINALPNTASTSEIARLKISSKFRLFGLFTISKDYYNNTAYAPGTQMPVDGVPGGLNPLAGPNLDVPRVNLFVPIPGIFGFLGYVSVNTSGTPANFTFVPVGSALDVSPFTSPVFSQKYVAGFNANYPSASATFIAQETGSPAAANVTHLRFTARNSQWLYNEMEGIANSLNCSSECSPNASFAINGDNNFCTTSGTYSLANLPGATTVAWTTIPTGVVTINTPNATTTSLSKNYDGTFTLRATVSNSCGGASHVINRNMLVAGFPAFGGPTGADTAWPNGNYYYYANLPLGYPPATDYFWEVPAGWTILSGQGTNILYVRTGTTGGAIEVDVTACGITRPTYKYVEIGSGSVWPDSEGGEVMRQTVLLSPNPTESSVNITIKNKDIRSTRAGNTSFNTITIYDVTGAVKKRLQYPAGTKQATLLVNDLRPGTYIVEMSDGGKYVERQRLLIQK